MSKTLKPKAKRRSASRKTGKRSRRTPKGAMREPTQKPSAVDEWEEAKRAHQEFEESVGDWSMSR